MSTKCFSGSMPSHVIPWGMLRIFYDKRASSLDDKYFHFFSIVLDAISTLKGGEENIPFSWPKISLISMPYWLLHQSIQPIASSTIHYNALSKCVPTYSCGVVAIRIRNHIVSFLHYMLGTHTLCCESILLPPSLRMHTTPTSSKCAIIFPSSHCFFQRTLLFLTFQNNSSSCL